MLLFENSCFDNQLRYGGLPIPTWCPSNVPVRTMVSAIEKRIERRGVSLMSFDRASVMALLSTLCTCLESRLLDPWVVTAELLRDQDSGRTANEGYCGCLYESRAKNRRDC